MIETISVVIPTYNRAAFICRAVESVLDQSFRYFEVIVVDDGSTDNTSQVLEKFKGLPNFQYLYQGNKGRSIARNEGLQNAAGNWVMYLDSDDYLDKNALQTLYNLAIEAKDSVIVYGNLLFFDNNGTDSPARNHFNGKSLNQNLFLEMVENKFCLTKTGTYIIRKEFALHVGRFSPEFEPCEDMDFSFRMLPEATASYINDIVLYVERHSGNTDEIVIQQAIVKVCKHYFAVNNEWKQKMRSKEMKRANCALKLRIANGSYELNKHRESLIYYSRLIKSKPYVVFDRFILKQLFASLIPGKIKRMIKKN